MKSIKVRAYFDAVGDRSFGLICPEESLAVQAEKESSDINVIVAKYLRTGEMPVFKQGLYADISAMGDLRESLEQVQLAQEAFAELPAEVRRYFDNDPINLVEFAADPKNLDKAIELGLAVKAPSQPAAAISAGQADAKASGTPEA